MKKYLLTASLVFGTYASAMPAFEGKYKCTNQATQEVSDVTFRTTNNVLFVTGIEQVTSEGIPCTNEVKSEAQGDLMSVLKTQCTEKELTVDLSMRQLSQKVDFNVLLKFELDGSNVNMNLSSNGNVGEQPIDVKLTLICVK